MAPPPRWRTWLQLLRAPNLFTVPGDPLAGYLLANSGFLDATLWLGIAASLCLYAAGLLLNDLADLAEDRRERPRRPLPSGAARPAHVWLAAGVLSLAGLGLLALTGRPAALGMGAALLLLVLLYNFFTKHWLVLGALNMGLCRSCSVLVGAVLGPVHTFELAMTAALGFGAYIAAVTHLARFETRPRVPWLALPWPFVLAALTAAGGIAYAVCAPARVPAAYVFAAAVLVAGWLAFRLFRTRGQPLPPFIGAHIRLLLLLQAGMAWLGDPEEIGWICALVLVALWPVSRWVARWFYAS